MTQFDDIEKAMGFSQDEPATFLRLKTEDRPEVVIFKGMESVEANQGELEKGYHYNGKVILFNFVSPLTNAERTHRTGSKWGTPGLFVGLKNASVPYEKDEVGKPTVREVAEGETVKIDRTGEGQDTRYNVTVLSQEEVEQYVKENRQADPASSTIGMPASTIPANEMDTEKKSEEEINVEDIPF